MRVQLWLLMLHVHACMRMDAYGMLYRKNVVDFAYMYAIDRWQVGRHVPTQRVVHNQSVCLVYDVWRMMFGQCAVYVEAASIGETKNKLYACAWTRRSIYSRPGSRKVTFLWLPAPDFLTFLWLPFPTFSSRRSSASTLFCPVNLLVFWFEL